MFMHVLFIIFESNLLLRNAGHFIWANQACIFKCSVTGLLFPLMFVLVANEIIFDSLL